MVDVHFYESCDKVCRSDLGMHQSFEEIRYRNVATNNWNKLEHVKYFFFRGIDTGGIACIIYSYICFFDVERIRFVQKDGRPLARVVLFLFGY